MLVPDAAVRGTNAAWRAPGDLFPLRFGNDSFLPHLASAKATGSALRCARICRGLRGMSIVPKIFASLRLPAVNGGRRNWCAVGISTNGFRPAMGKRAAGRNPRDVSGEVRILPIAVAEEIRPGAVADAKPC